MVQPDPIITDPLNPQNWNPYSYVMNNPLNLIDPSGYSFLSKYWRTIVAVVVTVYTGGMAASATSGWAAAGWAAGGGFVAGAIQTDSLRGGVYGAFSGLVFNGIGRAYGNMAQANAAAGTRTLGSTGLTAGQFTGMIIANGAAGGVMSSLQGGKFGHGFASAGFTTGASPMIGQAGGSMAQGTAAALVGGTASVMTGGKLATGAVSGAFSKEYGDFQRRRDVARSSVGGREIPGDIKKGVDAANKANERLQELKVLSMTAEDPRELLNPWRNATLAISEELNVEISSKLYESMGRYFLAPAFSSGSPNWVNADLGPSIAGANLAGFFHTHPGGTSLLSGNDTHVGQDMLGRTISPVVYVGAVGSLSPPVIWNTLTRSQEYVP